MLCGLVSHSHSRETKRRGEAKDIQRYKFVVKIMFVSLVFPLHFSEQYLFVSHKCFNDCLYEWKLPH